MPSDERFEQILRDKLYDYELPPPMHLLHGVVQKRRRRKLAIWVLTLSASFLLIGGMGWWMRQSQATKPPRQLKPMMPQADVAASVSNDPVAQRPAEFVRGAVAASENQAGLQEAKLSERALNPLPRYLHHAVRTQHADQGGLVKRRSRENTLTQLPIAALSSMPNTLRHRQLAMHNGCPSQFDKKWHSALFAEAYTGPWMGLSQIRGRRPQFAFYAQARRETESPRLGYTAGLRLALLTSKGWSARVGIEWSSLHERFYYEQENEERLIIITRYDEWGNVIGVDTTIEVGTLIRHTTNYIRMANLPLQIGWTYRSDNRRWTWGGQIGVVGNLGLWAKGDLLSPELEPVSLMEADAQYYTIFKPRVGWAASLGLSCSWMPIDGLRLFVQPTVRRWRTSFTNDNYPLRQHYTEVGVQMGVRWQL